MFIYIHLPFCLSRCIYCDFAVELKGTDARRRTYLDALKREITFHLGRLQKPLTPIETLYIGGGTPALFTTEEIHEILALLQTFAPFAENAEITLEANPDGMASAPEAYLNTGINRLSIGIQSFQPNELKRLSRIHSGEQAARFIQKFQAAGFDNISIDLMYGIPEQTLDSWQDTLKQAANLNVQHISMYGLQVETGTNMEKLLHQGRFTIPDEEATVDMYFAGINRLQSSGFQLYEISNLCQPGFVSRHNLNYWDNGEFWGFGLGAHGFIKGQRYENTESLATYLENPTQPSEIHVCSLEEQLENAFIFGLRKRAGVSIPQLESTYDFDFETTYGSQLQRYLAAGLLQREAGQLTLSEAAIPVSNEILAAFIR